MWLVARPRGSHRCGPLAWKAVVSSLSRAAVWGWPQVWQHRIISGIGKWDKSPVRLLELASGTCLMQPTCPVTHRAHTPHQCSPNCVHILPRQAYLPRCPHSAYMEPTSSLEASCWLGPVPRVDYLVPTLAVLD